MIIPAFSVAIFSNVFPKSEVWSNPILVITDNSGFKVGQHGIPSTGIPYVIVNGTIVVKDSKVLPVKPGQQIRFPIEPKGKFKPLSREGWLNEHTIGLNPDLLDDHTNDDSGMGVQLKKHN